MAADGTPEDRLEAALERIARIVDEKSTGRPVAAYPDPAVTEFSYRLDRIIETLREALGK